MKALNTRDVRVDRYIENAQPFAQEILRLLRSRVHETCPSCEETMKWSFPHFMYQGKILCSMAAFQKHCAFGFWLASKMKETSHLLETDENRSAMGDLGKIKQVTDLPDPLSFRILIQEAMYLIDQGVTLEKKLVKTVPLPDVPSDLLQGLAQNPAAGLFFESLPPGQQKEYVMWILEAKTEATREKRIQTTLEWCAEGKKRYWKYEAC